LDERFESVAGETNARDFSTQEVDLFLSGTALLNLQKERYS